MKYEPAKNEPKTMKAKADLMLKRGSISESQHKKLHAKADVEISKGKLDKPKADGAKPEAGADATETPKGRKKAIKDDVMRGEPDDLEERDQ